MSNLNKCMFIGRLGKDPEIREISSDFKVATFSLAISEKYKKDGETKENTEWISCQASNKLAGIIEQYVHKGDMLYVEGKMKTRSYDNKDGVKVYVTFIQVDAINMFPKASNGETSQTNFPIKDQVIARNQAKNELAPDDSDLPF